jgi:hypothetical protein
MAENNKMTFIVGAGASFELNLPVGEGLKKIIAQLLDTSNILGYGTSRPAEMISNFQRSLIAHIAEHSDCSQIWRAALTMSKAMDDVLSIDNYIHNHRGNQEIVSIGKMAITKAILEAEKNSLIFHSPKGKFEDKFWLQPFVQRLFENCSYEDLEERLSSVTFIVFNYDRCIEHYIYFALQRAYGHNMTAEKAAELINRMTIFHPYGTVGPLEWQEVNEYPATPFGCDPGDPKLAKLSKGIKTFTEGTDPKSSEIIAIKEAVQEARKIIFLGFSFEHNNVALISPAFMQHSNRGPDHLYATAFHESKAFSSDVSDTLKALIRAGETNVRNDLSCIKIFKEFSRQLSFSR